MAVLTTSSPNCALELAVVVVAEGDDRKVKGGTVLGFFCAKGRSDISSWADIDKIAVSHIVTEIIIAFTCTSIVSLMI